MPLLVVLECSDDYDGVQQQGTYHVKVELRYFSDARRRRLLPTPPPPKK